MSKRIVLFLLLTGCSYASDGRAISQLFFLLAMFVTACTGGGKFKAKAQPDESAGDASTAPTDAAASGAPHEGRPPYGVLVTLTAPEGDSFQGTVRAIGDVNGDGREDLGTHLGSQYGDLRVVLGGPEAGNPVSLDRGVRGFFVSNGAFGNGAANVVSGDINGDGVSDLVFVRYGSYASDIEVIHGRPITRDVDLDLLEDGRRTLSGAHTQYNRDVKVGDFNGDGLDDLFVPQPGYGTVRVVFGSGADGAVPLNSLASPEAIDIDVSNGMENLKYNEEHSVLVLGDFNGDGRDDVFIQKYRSYYGSFFPVIVFGDEAATDVNTGNYSTRRFLMWGYSEDLGAKRTIPQVGDINGDGNDDLVFVARNGSKVTVVFGAQGAGNYSQDVNATTWGIGDDGLIITGDFAPVKSEDYTSYYGSDFWVGNDRYSPKYYVDRNYYAEKHVLVGDVNADGKDDIVIAGKADSDKVYVVFGSSASGVTDVASLVASGDAFAIGGNLGDSPSTSYTYNSYTGYYYDYYSATTFRYWDQKIYNDYYLYAPKLVAVGRFDSGVAADIVVANQSNEATLVLGKTSPTNINVDTATAGVFPLDASDVVEAVLLDYNGDGFKDVATVSSDGSRITIFGRLP